ncbi:cytochrome P450 [Delitschia confertaspora ATCC 74209]|uniref:Cytochrome P450 n=1 Tax=Delitschia confertaspora ATCC 74209 TaxID=1513339 RepID=A0A9P4JNM7_9PLEO|nr:cytochrome P450 [Delitschia confertaspora ATCC 74209]
MLSLQSGHQLAGLLRNKLFVGGIGILSHFVLSHGEPDFYFHYILLGWTTIWTLATGVVYTTDSNVHSLSEAIAVTMSAAGVYYGSLLFSMLVYRAFFHRLRKFPGPFMAGLSKFYGMSLAAKNYQYYRETEKLHAKYGDYVRTGPRELSITDADAIPFVHGPTSKCRKGAWYNSTTHIEDYSLQTTRDKTDHRDRRRIWDRGFNAKALRDYEPRINRHSRYLMEKLAEHAREPCVKISNWFNFYSFDVMGDIGFDRSFGMLEKGKEDEGIDGVHKSMANMTFFGHVPWLMSLLLRTPVGAKDLRVFMKWVGVVLKERKKRTPNEPDVFSWLVNSDDENIPLRLNADTRLLIVAGSDTTSATLTWLVYELCKNPEKQAKLRRIVDEAAGDKPFLDVEDVATIPYLDGVINEALRLHPAVPSGVSRETPPTGITIPSRNIHIPGQTTIWMPTHTIQRSPAYFPSPLTFLPERWTSEAPDMVRDKRAFLAFSTGPYNCVGQKLSIMEMRSVVSNLVRRFEVRFAEGEDGEGVGGVINGTMDCFTTNVGSLNVILKARNVAGG